MSSANVADETRRGARSVGGMSTVSTVHDAPPAFHLLAKPTGAVCNLDCAYCFFLSKEMLYPGSRFRMADDMLGRTSGSPWPQRPLHLRLRPQVEALPRRRISRLTTNRLSPRRSTRAH